MKRLESTRIARDFGKRSRGFTLIEVLISISVFSLLMLIAYQALGLTAQSKQAIAKESSAQSELRTTHRLLSNLMTSGASFSGELQWIEVDLSTATTAWLAGSDNLFLGVSDSQDLLAELDGETEQSVLLSGVDGLSFRYFDGKEFSQQWQSKQAPRALVVDWERNGEVYQWWFKRP